MSNRRITTLVAAAIAFLPSLAAAAPEESSIAQAIAALREKHPALEVVLNTKTGLPSALAGLEPAATGVARASTIESAARVVEDYLHSKEVATLVALSGSRQGARVLSELQDPDFPGQTIVKVQATLDDIPIFGSQAAVVVRAAAAAVTQVASTISNIAEIPTTHAINPQAAIAKAQRVYQDLLGDPRFGNIGDPDHAGYTPEAKLVIFEGARWHRAELGTRLAWLVSLRHLDVLIDATDAQPLYSYTQLVGSRTLSVYDLARTETFPGTLMLSDDPTVAKPLAPQDASAAYAGLGNAYDYFKHLGRDSFDGAGARIRAYVRYGQERNAYWDRQSEVMLLGPGYASGLDVMAHELTHACVYRIVKSPYRDEPGAVDEFLADFFGAMTARAHGQTDWTIGATLPGRSPQHPLRSLSDPHLGGFDRDALWSDENSGQPDHLDELVRRTDPICANLIRADDGCVHFNSGILGKAAYLAAVGGTHSHSQITVTPIGSDKLARILYRTLGEITPSSGLLDTAIRAVAACGELASNQTYAITASDCTHLTTAFEAVGLHWTTQ